MELLDLNATSVLCGLAVVLMTAFIRLHWPFRFQYIGSMFRRKPDRLMRWLEASYRKNRSRSVAMLDKSTHEIMSGNYEQAEQCVAEGLALCKNSPTLFHQAMIHYLFYNLSTIYFYQGKYKDALEVAFRVFERDNRLFNALGVIICAYARMGEVQGAWEMYQLLPQKRVRVELRLFCLAEIEAAKGDYGRAVHYLHRLIGQHYFMTMHLNHEQIEKRISEWTKASSHVG
ncbi:hypothetical protein LOK74_11520 [Brevibacillus humidisoli]|uniref:tetratricopeptide repeat protein n=1 Tax=Brevibacillus humidisoli TaxID=2895522 RepID=UPI001E32B6AF|nr:hypothetical protein [Brevibacillus humidisoli]UFJ43068.1 hypothetical protein LOK74_11520 [Brevibacillus humidisoli]